MDLTKQLQKFQKVYCFIVNNTICNVKYNKKLKKKKENYNQVLEMFLITGNTVYFKRTQVGKGNTLTKQRKLK